MNENLNLVEILKDAPIGIELYSPICGTVLFCSIDDDSIEVSVKNYPSSEPHKFLFDIHGVSYGEYGECLLFPSKENRNWQTFKAPWKHQYFEPFQKNIDKGINSNGFDYVDLGLPSGTKWATMNVGASKPSDFGLYFQWGDVRGFTKGQIGRDKAFSWSTYKWSVDGSDSNFSKYNTVGDTLDLEDDAANIHMGGDWHMPTPTQIRELMDNTTSERTEQNGVKGIKFTSKKDTSKSIFIPAAGLAWDGSVPYSGDSGSVWSSMLYAGRVDYGQYLYFGSGDAYLSYNYRYSGCSVRGVIG